MHVGRVLRKIAWIAGITILVCVVLILIALAPTEDLPSFIRHNTRALTTRRFDSTPERLKRGRYITQTVAHCFACHSPREDHPAHHGSFVPGQDAKGQFGTWGGYRQLDLRSTGASHAGRDRPRWAGSHHHDAVSMVQ